jgi:hypothetical protein
MSTWVRIPDPLFVSFFPIKGGGVEAEPDGFFENVVPLGL